MLLYRAVLPLSWATLTYVASAFRRHGMQIGSRWRKGIPGQHACWSWRAWAGREARGAGRQVQRQHSHGLVVRERDCGTTGGPRPQVARGAERREEAQLLWHLIGTLIPIDRWLRTGRSARPSTTVAG
jgi:hypothetical protein